VKRQRSSGRPQKLGDLIQRELSELVRREGAESIGDLVGVEV
jgi:hypothetical protein